VATERERYELPPALAASAAGRDVPPEEYAGLFDYSDDEDAPAGRETTCWDPRCTSHEDGYVGNPDAPPEGEFVQRFDGNSNVHIARLVLSGEYGTKVVTACGGGWYSTALRHASGDSPRQCAKCWEAM
jgi:hypothetical protein